jgi:hypothetical protein
LTQRGAPDSPSNADLHPARCADTLATAENFEQLRTLGGNLVVRLFETTRLDVEEVLIGDLLGSAGEERLEVGLALGLAVCGVETRVSLRGAEIMKRRRCALMSKWKLASVSCRSLSAFSFSSGVRFSGRGRLLTRTRQTE